MALTAAIQPEPKRPPNIFDAYLNDLLRESPASFAPLVAYEDHV
jgi:hypothetical protein